MKVAGCRAALNPLRTEHITLGSVLHRTSEYHLISLSCLSVT